MKEKTKAGMYISGSGTNMMAIVEASRSGVVDFEPAFVGSDNPDAKGLVWAKEQGIPTFVVDYRTVLEKFNAEDVVSSCFCQDPDLLNGYLMKSRGVIPRKFFKDGKATKEGVYWFLKKVSFEREMIKSTKPFSIDLLVLAGFMRNLTAYFIDCFEPDENKYRIMNIHPALLPMFPGTDGYGDTVRYGCKVGGCTVHFVDYGEDTGPIIGQRAILIKEGESVDEFRKRGLTEEYQLYPECIQLFAEGRLNVVPQEQRDGSIRKVVTIIGGL